MGHMNSRKATSPSMSACRLWHLAACGGSKKTLFFDPILLEDAASLIDFIVHHINSDNLSEKECWNTTSAFPSEYALQGEMFSVLREVLAPLPPVPKRGPWTVLLEAKSKGSSGRADILLQDGRRILIELKSNQYYDGMQDLLEKHVNQAANDAKVHRCDEVVLVNLASPVWKKQGGYLQPGEHFLKLQAANGLFVVVMQGEMDQGFKFSHWFHRWHVN